MLVLPISFTSIIIISDLLTKLSLGLILPRKHTAVFHERPNKDGYKIAYRDGPLAWSNLQHLQRIFSAKANKTADFLCVTGFWLIYPHPGYTSGLNDSVSLISGKDTCVNASNLGAIGSMQPLMISDKSSKSAISIFSKPNFSSFARTFSEHESKKHGLKQLDGDGRVRSLIVIGDKPWSLMSPTGKIVCVRPQHQTKGLSICVGPEIEQLEDFRVNAVFPDCPIDYDESVVANLKLIDCIEFGSGKIEPLNAIATTGRTSRNVMDCQYNITWDSMKFSEAESAIITKLLTIRLTHDFESTEQILWPDAREDIWKTGPLDTAFDIMIATVPDDIVNPHFLMILREFTVYHLNEVWMAQRENGEDTGSLKSWRSHKVLVHLMNKCLTHATATKERYIENIRSSYSQRSNLEDFNDKINPDLILNTDFDPIIEMAWVVSNYAMGLCHNLFEYKINFWDNFITTFGHLYFRPLEERWKNPSVISPKTWGVILSGFGIDIQYRRMAFATSRILELTPKLQPFEKDFEIEIAGY